MNHDLLLTRKDGSVRCFRIYDWPTPKVGDVVTLPIDGRPIKARVQASERRPELSRSVDAEAVEI